MGLEKRAFYFTKGPKGAEHDSFVAVDGGLIETRVYRSSDRARRVQEPPTYKCQEEYGIK